MFEKTCVLLHYILERNDRTMKDLTCSLYTFEDLINGNYLYVDKTEFIWSLVKPDKGLFFMVRPRRFGKSLTLSTLKAVFQGRKDLFKGLALYDKPYDWKQYPIIHLDMGNCMSQTADELEQFIFDKLAMIAAQFGLELQGASNLPRFEKLIGDLYEQGPVVILVDEYDKPILNNALSSHLPDILAVLKEFYSTIKTCDGMERFVFVTGVSKFAHVSIFSDLNNLTDITMDARYACMLGYTQDELESYFGDRIAALAGDGDIDEFKHKIKDWYNGYRFEETAKTVYNPVSLAMFFESGGKFNNYWFSTGTPSFLLKLISKQRFDLESVLSSPVSSFAFDAYEIDNLNPLTLLLQTGYLTIQSATKRYGDTAYQLCFPNLEVKGAFETYLAGHCSGLQVDQVKDSVYILADAVTAGDVDGFMEAMKVFFAKVPYNVHMKDENNFRLLFFSIFLLLGISITAESKTNNGRIDAVAANDDYVFVFEFKLDKTAEIAMDQIKDRDYYRRYMNSDKKIILIGVSFDKDAGQIGKWMAEIL